jgi:hypothetical protein
VPLSLRVDVTAAQHARPSEHGIEGRAELV